MKYVIALAGLCLIGCSSSMMSEQECTSTNWRVRGVTDAWQGKYSSTIHDYQDACSEYGLTPNSKQWKQGYFHTLHQQCTPSKAMYILMTNPNQAYTGPCMADPDFAKVMNTDKAKIQQQIRMQKIEDRLKEIAVERSKHKNDASGQDLAWEEYQLQQELLDMKSTVQITTPEHINNFLFDSKK